MSGQYRGYNGSNGKTVNCGIDPYEPRWGAASRIDEIDARLSWIERLLNHKGGDA